LCTIEGTDVDRRPIVELELACQQRHVEYDIVETGDVSLPLEKKRILEVFFNKCIRTKNGMVVLCSSVMRAKRPPR